jgi:hypothetical protein
VISRRLDKAVHNFFAQSRALVFWQDCDVADVRAVSSVCQGSAGSVKYSLLIGEAAEPAVREDSLQVTTKGARNRLSECWPCNSLVARL